ncbi:YihY/virulence factor BrkB family protein [Salinarimonas soli]|uniref:YihY/virulence factor BrkB family protein n=2 Tax=Salinarimonas soli TaxID=1638099 RepID=A0A5B2VCM4_9HYPH|nr:YihY/virulence factor BrkB family protein [Salinarimonas soli]
MQLPSAWLIVLRAALVGWWDDRAMSLAAAISFFTVFSLAPMLLVAIAVAGLVFGQEAAQGAIVAEFGGMLGKPTAEMIEALIASAANVESGIRGTVIGTVTFLVLVTGAVLELQDDLNLVWKVPPPKHYGLLAFVRSRVLSFAILLGLGFLLLVSLIVDSALSALGAWLETRFSGAALILGAANAVVSFGIATLLFGMIYKLLPNVELTWRDVAVGALVTGTLFTAGKILIGWYLGASGVATSYGAAASLITILLWIYYSSLILLFGAEFTKAFAERHGSRRSAQP